MMKGKRGWNIFHPSNEHLDHKLEKELRSFSQRFGHPYQHVKEKFEHEWEKIPIAKRFAFERGILRGGIQSSYMVLAVLAGDPELGLGSILTQEGIPRVPRHKLRKVI